MVDVIFNIFCFILLQVMFVNMQRVTLTSEKRFVKKKENINLNCTSDIKPIWPTAGFLVDGKTFTNIRKTDAGCFNGNSLCQNGYCGCGGNNKTFTLRYNPSMSTLKFGPVTFTKNITFTCLVFFNIGSLKTAGDSVTVEVLDIDGPFITSKAGRHLDVGVTANLACSVDTHLNNYNLTLLCQNITSGKTAQRTCSECHPSIDFLVRADFRYVACSCTFTWNQFKTKTDARFEILNLNTTGSFDFITLLLMLVAVLIVLNLIPVVIVIKHIRDFALECRQLQKPAVYFVTPSKKQRPNTYGIVDTFYDDCAMNQYGERDIGMETAKIETDYDDCDVNQYGKPEMEMKSAKIDAYYDDCAIHQYNKSCSEIQTEELYDVIEDHQPV